MIKFIFIILFIVPILGFTQTKTESSSRRKKSQNVVIFRVKKINLYYENGQLRAKGKKKRYKEHLGCLGLKPVYRKNGRWKFYDEKGELLKIIRYKKDKEIKVVEKLK